MKRDILTIRRACLLVQVLLLCKVPAAPAQPSFAGTWETTFGLMSLTQEGSAVQGFYLLEGGRGRLEGKVEHIASYEAARFHSLDELLAFMALVLSQIPRSGQ